MEAMVRREKMNLFMTKGVLFVWNTDQKSPSFFLRALSAVKAQNDFCHLWRSDQDGGTSNALHGF